MYRLKEDIEFYFKDNETQKQVADFIGISVSTLSRILNRKQLCSKTIAYMITIANTKNYKKTNIEDYFEKYYEERI